MRVFPCRYRRCRDAARPQRAGHWQPEGGRAGRSAAIDKVIAWVVVTIAGMLAVIAIIRFVMPPLADATNSLASSRDTLNADIDHVLEVSAVTMPDATTADVWVKNVGAGTVGEIPLIRVEFGREANAVPIAYGGAGCPAPCWSYDLGGEAAWTPGTTLAIRLELAAGAETDALYRVNVRGPGGGQATATVRAP